MGVSNGDVGNLWFNCGLTVVPVVKIFRPVYHGLATSKYGGLQATAKDAFRFAC